MMQRPILPVVGFMLMASASSLAACDDDESAPASEREDASVAPRDAAREPDASDAAADAGRNANAGGAGGKAGAGGTAGNPGTSAPCDDLSAPIERTGERGTVVARFVSIEPTLLYRGRYNWTIELHTPDGEPIGDAVLKAKAVMRAHGHGTSAIKLQHEAGSATYALNDVNLFMAGKWEVTLDITPDATKDDSDSVEFRACPRELPEDEPDAGDDAGTTPPRGRGHG